MATRRERVVLDLQDDFTAGIARAAAATTLFERSLNSLDGTSGRAQRSMSPLGDPGGPIGKTGNQSQRAGAEIDKLSGRLRLLTDVALILGPAIAPLGAAAVGGAVALTAQFGALAGGIGVTVLALKGVGDGLKALDAYQLEPTAENLKKLNQEMDALGPAGRNFVHYLDSIEPELKKLQNSAAAGLLPGAEEGIDALLERLPELRHLIRGMAETMGDLASDAGSALGGKRFDAFFEYLRTDGIKILDDTSRTLGYLAEAAANTIAAFGPLQTDFSGGLLEFSQGLAEASANLDSNAGFQEFVSYIEEAGPQVVDTLGALANAVLQIVEATAPLGGPVLQAIEGVANAIGVIADSDFGTPIFAALGALALYNRAAQATVALNGTAWGGKAIGGMKSYTSGLLAVTSAQERAQMSATELDAANKRNWGGMAKGGAIVAGLAFEFSGLSDKMGLANTTSLALMGSIAGPWGAAAGAGVGYILDIKGGFDDLNDSISILNNSSSIAQLTSEIADAKSQLDELKHGDDGFSFTQDLLGFDPGWLDRNLKDTTGKTAELEASIKSAESRLAGMKSGAGSTGDSLGDFGRVADETTRAVQSEAQAIAAATKAMVDQKDAAVGAFDAQTAYVRAMKEANQQAARNSAGIRGNKEAALKNRDALSGLISSWNNLDQTVTDNVGKFKQARDNFIKTAGGMGVSRDAATKLWQEMAKLPSSKVIPVTVQTGQANAALTAIKARMDGLKDRTVHVNVVTNNVRPQGGQAQTEDQVTTAPGKKPRRNPRVAGRSATGLSPLSPLDVYTSGRSAASAKADMYRQKADQDVASTSEDAATAVHHLAGAAWHASDGIKKWNDRVIEAQQKALDAANQRRDDALAQRDSISSSIQQGLGGDIWAASSGSVWGSGASAANSPAGALAQLQAQKARAQRLIAAINTLKAKGITGPVLLEIIGSGDVERAEAMASLDVGTLGSFASVYTDTQSTLAAAGLAGGNAVVGESNIARLEKAALDELKELREIKQAIKDGDKHNQQGHKDNAAFVTAGVNSAASNGHKRGKR